MNFQNLVLGGIAIAVIGSVSYKGVDLIRQNSSYIKTNGLSDRHVISDSAVWKIRVITESNNIQEAQAKMQKDMNDVLKLLRDKGIRDEEIMDISSDITDKFRWTDTPNNKMPRFEVENTIFVRVNTLGKIEKSVHQAKKKMSELIEKGIRVTNEIHYYYKDIDKLRVEMIKEAAKDSKNRAENVAESIGAKITGVRNLSSGRFSIYPEDQSVPTEYNRAEERSMKKRVRVIVSGTYNLKH